MDYFVFKEEDEALKANTLADFFYGIQFAKEENISKVLVANQFEDMQLEIEIKENNKILNTYLEIEKLFYKIGKEIEFEDENSIKNFNKILNNFAKRIEKINADELFLALELSKLSLFYDPNMFLFVGSTLLGPSFKEFEEREVLFDEDTNENENFVA